MDFSLLETPLRVRNFIVLLSVQRDIALTVHSLQNDKRRNWRFVVALLYRLQQVLLQNGIVLLVKLCRLFAERCELHVFARGLVYIIFFQDPVGVYVGSRVQIFRNQFWRDVVKIL